jgi:hypothetical protein
MIVSAHRPYFCPFPGFFYKAMKSDVFVLLDDVQYPRGTTWINRNRFKNDQGCLWMTVPVWKKGLGLQNINEVRICHEGRWQRKHLESLKVAYGNAPYFREHLHLFEEVFSPGCCTALIDMNLEIIRYLMDVLGIETEIVLLSGMDMRNNGSRLLIDVCRFLGGSVFLAQCSARTYLDEFLFQDAGIQLLYVTPPAIVYPQLWGDFIGNLSVFDLLFNCGPKSRELMMGR